MSDFGVGGVLYLYMSRHSVYTELLQRHRKMVWGLCWKQAHGHYERCCDLVQEVSIALWLHFDDLRPDASPREERAWVRWWTRSVLDLQRRKERPSLLPLTARVADTVAADDLLMQKEEMEHLMAALNPEERELVRLHIEGYRSEEIAETMRLSRDAVYQRFHRAVVKMRRVALLLVLLCVAATVAVAVVPQWRKQVFSRSDKEETPEHVIVEQDESHPSPTLSATPEAEADTVALRPVWIPPEPLPYLTVPVDTALPDLPAQKPEVKVVYDGKRLVFNGLVDGELIVVRNTKGVLIALKRAHGTSCAIDFPAYRYSNTTYILQIGTRADRIRIDL